MTFKAHMHNTGAHYLFKMGDLENAVQDQIALDTFHGCDIGLYWPRGLSHVNVRSCLKYSKRKNAFTSYARFRLFESGPDQLFFFSLVIHFIII